MTDDIVNIFSPNWRVSDPMDLFLLNPVNRHYVLIYNYISFNKKLYAPKLFQSLMSRDQAAR